MKTPRTVTRLLLLLLILAVILPLAACGKTEEPAQDPAGSAGTTDVSPAEESEEQTPAVISDDLPEKDFGGKSFRVLVETGKKQELFVDEYNGNVEKRCVV